MIFLTGKNVLAEKELLAQAEYSLLGSKLEKRLTLRMIDVSVLKIK